MSRVVRLASSPLAGRLRRAVLATALSTTIAAVPVAAQEAPPRPPERPPNLGRLDLDPPLPIARPAVEDDAPGDEAQDGETRDGEAPEGEADAPEPGAVAEDDEAESPALDARTDDSPLPPRRPPMEEPEAVLPDAPRAPLDTDPAERADYEACLAELDDLGVVYEEVPAIDGEGRCGAAYPLLVEAVGAVALSPAVTVQCPVARALAGWSEEALVPAAREHLGTRPTTLFTSGSYACRGRNRAENARLSEHAFANALDLTGIGFETRTAVPVEPRGAEEDPAEEDPEAAFQREIRRAACAHFRTVLGPGADAYHDDHLHFDQRERKNDYRLCE
ncbi:extensin family protein [Salinarimonas rosea]|uniref:extensin family protein n=1 Tax=Salinarimonas rosea TaxID=552063 RepID=UPI0009FF1053|nr:extensin family protein [Salinarimonas rosea]